MGKPSTDKVHFFTVATVENIHLRRFLSSCEFWGIQPEVLGWGQTFTGWNMKLELIRDYLKTLPEDALFLYTDAFDVAYLSPPEEIYERLSVVDKPLILAADYSFFATARAFGFPRTWRRFLYWLRRPTERTEFMHPCAGVYGGRAGPVAHLLHEISRRHVLCDQYEMHQVWRRDPEFVHLDTEQQFFAGTSGRVGMEKEFYTQKDNRLVCRKSGVRPLAFHGGGENHMGLDRVLEGLPYAVSTAPYSMRLVRKLRCKELMSRAAMKFGVDYFLVRFVAQKIFRYYVSWEGYLNGGTHR